PVAATIVPSPVPSAVPTAPAKWIEAPPEWAIERVDPDERVAVGVGIPVPSRVETRSADILACDLVVGFSKVLRTQAAPVVEVILCLVCVEARRLLLRERLVGRSGNKRQFVVRLHHAILAVADFNRCFSIEDHRGWLVRVKFVEAVLHQLRGNSGV